MGFGVGMAYLADWYLGWSLTARSFDGNEHRASGSQVKHAIDTMIFSN